MKWFIFFLSIFMLSGTACEGKKKTKRKRESSSLVQVAKIEDGIVHENITIKFDETQTYALYLPKGLDTGKRYPCLVFADPQGNGARPLHVYKTLADSFQVILVGSNTSKNGLSFEQTDFFMASLLKEVESRYPVQNNFSLCGHSGGAKVALHYASQHAHIHRVIYVGGVTAINPIHPIKILGFAGLRDMNYADLVVFLKMNKSDNLTNNLIEWNGKHDFPDAKTFVDGFLFILDKEIPDFGSKQVSTSEEALIFEQQEKQRFLEAFNSRSIAWWKNEVEKLRKKSIQDLVSERLLGFVSLACYSFSTQSLNQKDTEKAAYVLQIYEMVDPKNEDMIRFKDALAKLKSVTQEQQ
jgi:pimeloyl-ACP methyl ester carboxylesterase